jgi:hypothetical protein
LYNLLSGDIITLQEVVMKNRAGIFGTPTHATLGLMVRIPARSSFRVHLTAQQIRAITENMLVLIWQVFPQGNHVD